jgi:hypothetical protein
MPGRAGCSTSERLRGSIPQYRSGQFGRQQGSATGWAGSESQSLNTDQVSSDACFGRFIRGGRKVTIPQYRSGQFGHCYCPQPPSANCPGPESQSLNTDQVSSDEDDGAGEGSAVFSHNPSIQIRSVRTRRGPPWPRSARSPRVTIPQYRSGQFGLRAFQLVDSKPLERAFWITSQIHIGFHLPQPFRQLPFPALSPDSIGLAVLRITSRSKWHSGPGMKFSKTPSRQFSKSCGQDTALAIRLATGKDRRRPPAPLSCRTRKDTVLLFRGNQGLALALAVPRHYPPPADVKRRRDP